MAVGSAVVACVLVALTLYRFGFSAIGVTWSAAQVLLVVIALVDASTRRIPNRIVLPASLVAVALRAAFAPSSAPRAIVTAALVLVLFGAFAVATRSFGLGDVKLAALLGLLLGTKVLPALLLGATAGGIAAVAVLLSRRGTRRDTIAYGPYLCLGAALTVLALGPPPLV